MGLICHTDRQQEGDLVLTPRINNLGWDASCSGPRTSSCFADCWEETGGLISLLLETNTPWFPSSPQGPSFLLTLQDLHGQDGPGVLQVGDVQVARRVAGQADVQHPEREETRRHRHTRQHPDRSVLTPPPPERCLSGVTSHSLKTSPRLTLRTKGGERDTPVKRLFLAFAAAQDYMSVCLSTDGLLSTQTKHMTRRTPP